MFKDQTTPDVKDRILDVSRELFIKNGFDSTSIRDIAAASDTNVAMVNYYFHSKYNLFEIIFEEAFDILMDRVFSILQQDIPFFELIELWIDAYYETLIEYPQLPIFILNEINQNPERLTERIQRRDPFLIFDQMATKIAQEVKKGTIKETPPIDFILNVMSMCIFPFMIGSMASKVAQKSSGEYNTVIKSHKKYVIEFVINAIVPNKDTKD